MGTMRWGIRGMVIGLALTLLGGCAAGSSAPSPADALDEGALFEIIDRDRNGTVTEEEFVRVYEDKTAARREFETLDTNHDNALSRDEFGNLRLFLVRW
jgi:Ca2+-binding EF-hand superfamily protein